MLTTKVLECIIVDSIVKGGEETRCIYSVQFLEIQSHNYRFGCHYSGFLNDIADAFPVPSSSIFLLTN